MSQTFANLVSGSTQFGDLYGILNNNYAAVASNFSGVTFPANPSVGWPCLRTDINSAAGGTLYIYTGNSALGLAGWVDLSTLTAASATTSELVAARGTFASLLLRLNAQDTADAAQQAEIVAARGGQADMNTRITGIQSEVVAARGTQPNVTSRISAIENEIILGRGTAANLAGFMDTAHNPDGTLKQAAPAGGWWVDLGSAVTYVSANTFTIAGEQMEVFVSGRGCRCRLTGPTYVYGYVTSSTWASGTNLTTVVLQMSGGASLTNTLNKVEYGQEPANAPVAGTSVMPQLNMNGITTFYAGTSNIWLLANSNKYSHALEYDFKVLKVSDQTDQTSQFSITPGTNQFTIIRNGINNLTQFDFQFRVLEHGYTWSAWSTGNLFSVDAPIAPVINVGAYGTVAEQTTATWTITNHAGYSSPTYTVVIKDGGSVDRTSLFTIGKVGGTITLGTYHILSDTTYTVSIYMVDSFGAQSYTASQALVVTHINIQTGPTLLFTNDTSGWPDANFG